MTMVFRHLLGLTFHRMGSDQSFDLDPCQQQPHRGERGGDASCYTCLFPSVKNIKNDDDATQELLRRPVGPFTSNMPCSSGLGSLAHPTVPSSPWWGPCSPAVAQAGWMSHCPVMSSSKSCLFSEQAPLHRASRSHCTVEVFGCFLGPVSIVAINNVDQTVRSHRGSDGRETVGLVHTSHVYFENTSACHHLSLR